MNLCKIDFRRGTESLVALAAALWEILWKEDRGAFRPPYGARVKCQLCNQVKWWEISNLEIYVFGWLAHKYQAPFAPRTPDFCNRDMCSHLPGPANALHSYTEWPITNSQRLISVMVYIKCIGISEFLISKISEFWYMWPKVRSTLRPLHYKSMGEKWKAPVLDENHSKHSSIA